MRRAAILLGLLLTGCPSGPLELKPVSRPSQVVPHVVIDPASGQVPERGSAIAGGRLTVQVLKAGSAERILGATVTVLGPTPAWASTVASGDISLEPLQAGTYAVRAAAPGYATIVQGGVTVDPAAPATAVLTLAPGGVVTGTAKDQAGQALAGARASVGEAAAIAGSDGSFRLEGVPLGSQTLTLARTGYLPSSLPLQVVAQTSAGTFTLGPGNRTVAFDNASQVFSGGRTVWDSLASARQALVDGGFAVATGAASQPDIRVVVAPSAASYPDPGAAAESLASFVAKGGKLILLGEWGGFEGYSPVVLDRLAQPYGFDFGADLLRVTDQATPEDPAIANVSLPWPVAGGIKLWGASTIFAPPPAMVLASSGPKGYRVASYGGDWPVAIALCYGKGLVVAVGDASAWTDPHLGEAGNRGFWSAIFAW